MGDPVIDPERRLRGDHRHAVAGIHDAPEYVRHVVEVGEMHRRVVPRRGRLRAPVRHRGNVPPAPGDHLHGAVDQRDQLDHVQELLSLHAVAVAGLHELMGEPALRGDVFGGNAVERVCGHVQNEGTGRVDVRPVLQDDFRRLQDKVLIVILQSHLGVESFSPQLYHLLFAASVFFIAAPAALRVAILSLPSYSRSAMEPSARLDPALDAARARYARG